MLIRGPKKKFWTAQPVYGAAGGGSFTPSSTQSSNFLTRVAAVTGTGSPTYGLSTTERNAIDTMITGIVGDLGGNTSLSTWPILDAMYVLATTSTGVAALNLISSSFTLVTHGSLTFAADVGYTGDGSTGYLDTQWVPGVNGVNFTLNGASLGAYIQSTSALSTSVIMGAADGGGAQFDYFVPVQSGNFYWDINAATFPNFANASPQGAWVVSRTSNTATNVYKNGSTTAVGTSSDTATSLISAGSVLLFALNSAGSASNFTNYQASAFFVGGGMTGTQAAAINNRINNYMTALGANHVF